MIIELTQSHDGQLCVITTSTATYCSFRGTLSCSRN